MSTEQQFLKKLNAMQKAFDAKVKQVQKQSDADIKQLRKQYEADVKQVIKQSDADVKQLRKQYDADVKQLRKQYAEKPLWCRDQKALDKFRTDVQKHTGLNDFETGEFIKESLGYSRLTRCGKAFVKSRKQTLGKDEVLFVSGDPLRDGSKRQIKFFSSYDALMKWASKYDYYFINWESGERMPRTLASLRSFFVCMKLGDEDDEAGVLKCSDLIKVLDKAKAMKTASRSNIFDLLNTGTSLPTDMAHIIADMARPWCKDQKELDKFVKDVQKRIGLDKLDKKNVRKYAGEHVTSKFIKETLGPEKLHKLTGKFVKSKQKKLGEDEILFVTHDNSLQGTEYTIKFFPSYDALVEWATGRWRFYFRGGPQTLEALRKHFVTYVDWDIGTDVGVLKCSDLEKVLRKTKSRTPAEWRKHFKEHSDYSYSHHFEVVEGYPNA